MNVKNKSSGVQQIIDEFTVIEHVKKLVSDYFILNGKQIKYEDAVPGYTGPSTTTRNRTVTHQRD
jgi:hypothetical protein